MTMCARNRGMLQDGCTRTVVVDGCADCNGCEHKSKYEKPSLTYILSDDRHRPGDVCIEFSIEKGPFSLLLGAAYSGDATKTTLQPQEIL